MSRVDHWASVQDVSSFKFKNGKSIRQPIIEKKEVVKETDNPIVDELNQLKEQIRARDAELTRLREQGEEEIATLCAYLEQEEVPSNAMNGHRIARSVAKKHGVSFREMISQRRQKHLVIARHEAMWLIRKFTSLSLPQIGAIFANRDHSSILHGIRAHERRIGLA